jgi:hypothetical protein
MMLSGSMCIVIRHDGNVADDACRNVDVPIGHSRCRTAVPPTGKIVSAVRRRCATP